MTGAWLAWAAAAPALGAQSLRLATWAAFDGVTRSQDWSAYGAQLAWASTAGHKLWANVEWIGRFGERDGAQKIGGVLHPAARWWISLEAGTALRPELAPKNSWELDLTALVSGRASLSLAYRRQNYVPGPVDVVMPHATLQIAQLSWEVRLFLARNPSARTDAAFLIRATAPLGRRAAGWLGAGAGRESYLVGAPPVQAVRSLKTVTGTAGVRYNAGRGFTLRGDVTVVESDPVLSRRGVALGVERSF